MGRHPYLEECLALHPASDFLEIGTTWKRGVSVEKSRCASWLQRTGSGRWGRTTDGTHRNTVGSEEPHVQFGDFLEGFNEPTSAISVLAPLTFKSVFVEY